MPSPWGKVQEWGDGDVSPLCRSPSAQALAGASSLAQFLLQAPWRPLLGLRLAFLTCAWAVGEAISLQPAGFEYGNDL